MYATAMLAASISYMATRAIASHCGFAILRFILLRHILILHLIYAAINIIASFH